MLILEKRIVASLNSLEMSREAGLLIQFLCPLRLLALRNGTLWKPVQIASGHMHMHTAQEQLRPFLIPWLSDGYPFILTVSFALYRFSLGVNASSPPRWTPPLHLPARDVRLYLAQPRHLSAWAALWYRRGTVMWSNCNDDFSRCWCWLAKLRSGLTPG